MHDGYSLRCWPEWYLFMPILSEHCFVVIRVVYDPLCCSSYNNTTIPGLGFTIRITVPNYNQLEEAHYFAWLPLFRRYQLNCISGSVQLIPHSSSLPKKTGYCFPCIYKILECIFVSTEDTILILFGGWGD